MSLVRLTEDRYVNPHHVVNVNVSWDTQAVTIYLVTGEHVRLQPNYAESMSACVDRIVGNLRAGDK